MRKPGLCTQNTPVHIMVHISLIVQDFSKQHGIPYEKLHTWCKFYNTAIIIYKSI